MRRRTDGIDLCQYVDAVAAVLHHPVQTTHLALDTSEAGQNVGGRSGLLFLLHL
jgi:hypothetical protein